VIFRGRARSKALAAHKAALKIIEVWRDGQKVDGLGVCGKRLEPWRC
jgi:hypothetical protein